MESILPYVPISNLAHLRLEAPKVACLFHKCQSVGIIETQAMQTQAMQIRWLAWRSSEREGPARGHTWVDV